MAGNSGYYLIGKFWKFLLGIFLMIIVFFLLVNFGLFGEMPDIKDLENPKSAQSSVVYSADGEILGCTIQTIIPSNSRIMHGWRRS